MVILYQQLCFAKLPVELVALRSLALCDATASFIIQTSVSRLDCLSTTRALEFAMSSTLLLSMSLCFSAFQALPHIISASSLVLFAEPRYEHDPESGRLDFAHVKKQNLTSFRSVEDRGVLSLAPKNWSATWDESETRDRYHYSYFHRMEIDTLLTMNDSGGANAVHLIDQMHPSFARADVSIGGLVLDILRSNGTIAEAVQSMLMVVLESRYGDYLFSKGAGYGRRYESSSSAQRADFIAVQIPGGRGQPANSAAGTTQSYVLVMSAVAIHSAIVCSIMAWCLKGT